VKQMDPHRNQQKKNKAGLIILVLLAVVLMVASVVMVVRFPEEDLWNNPTESDINNPATSGFICDAVEAQKLYPFGNGLVKLGHDRVSYLDLKGNELFGEAVSMEAPFCKISSNKALVVDTNGFQYLVLDTEKVLFKGVAKSTIDFGSINKDGYIALVMDEAGIKGVSSIFKPDGSGIFSWQSAESGYILSAEINPDSTLVDVLLVNTDGASVQPMLKRFGISGDAKGQFIPQITELLPTLLYDSDKNPVSCGVSDMISFDGTNEKYHLTFSKIYNTISSSKGILVVAKKEAGDVPSLYLVKKDGSISEGVPLSEEVTSIAVKDSMAAVGSGNAIVCVSLDKMKEKSRTPVSASPIRVGFASSSNQVIVVARDGVTTFVP